MGWKEERIAGGGSLSGDGTRLTLRGRLAFDAAQTVIYGKRWGRDGMWMQTWPAGRVGVCVPMFLRDG